MRLQSPQRSQSKNSIGSGRAVSRFYSADNRQTEWNTRAKSDILI